MVQVLVVAAGALSAPATVHRAERPVTAVSQPSTVSAVPDTAAVASGIGRLLQARDRALLRHDRAGYLAATRPATDARRASSAFFANIAAVPLDGWDETIDGATVKPAGAKDTFTAEVVRRYRITGFDPGGVAQRRVLTVAREGARWFVTSDKAAEGVRRELWESGKVVVRRGASSLVLAHPADTGRLAQYATIADAAVRTVTKVWGTGWSGRVVVVVPSTSDELGRVLDSSADYAQIAALATAEVVDVDGSRTSLAERVVLNPGTFGRLSPLGQRIVMAHEVTHVATRLATGKSMPVWLVEGFADYVAYRHSGVETRVAARDLIPSLRRLPLPSTLPADDRFDPAAADLGASYELAWLACRFIAERTSEATLIAFYKAVGSETSPQDEAVRRQFAAVLGSTPERFVTSWRRYVTEAVS
ncbi:MAG: hypothetical protein JWM93_246 [Frankiales bacterium]|nr:hypothetical protein [Frankiales bacterium]